MAPAVTSISPDHGPTGGGVSTTIEGSGFTSASRVSLSGTAAASFTVVDDDTITFVPAAGSAGTKDVEVGGASVACTLTDTGDLVGKTAHGLVAGDLVAFDTVVTTTGITLQTIYHVIAGGLTADVFKVSTTAGGSALALTTNGTGTYHRVGVLSAGYVVGTSDVVQEILNGGGAVLVNESGDDVYISRNADDPVAFGIKLTTADGPLSLRPVGGKVYAACASGDACDLRVFPTG